MVLALRMAPVFAIVTGEVKIVRLRGARMPAAIMVLAWEDKGAYVMWATTGWIVVFLHVQTTVLGAAYVLPLPGSNMTSKDQVLKPKMVIYHESIEHNRIACAFMVGAARTAPTSHARSIVHSLMVFVITVHVFVTHYKATTAATALKRLGLSRCAQTAKG
jgi:hypothetical protein